MAFFSTRALLAILSALIFGARVQAADEPADTLVLCPAPFRAALQTWLDYRQQQGYRILVLVPAGTSYAIHQQIRQTAAKQPLRNLVLIGDAVNDNAQGSNAIVPTDYKIAMVNVQFGGEPDLATDNAYADLDDDGAMDLTLGRIPVDSPKQLSEYIDKVIAYETKSDYGLWRRKINLVAGVGNFDPLIDRVIENTSKRMITDLIPASYETSITLTNWKSVYCPNPERLANTVVDRLNEGCLFWVYIGHGLPHCVAPMEVGHRTFPVLDNQSAARARSLHGSPIAVMLACYTGAFDRRKDCLGEVLVSQPSGPVACLCGSRMTMPYGMATLSYEIMQEYFHHDQATLGEVILSAKRHLAANIIDNEYRDMIETVGRTLSPTPDLLPLERYEHLQMFHLLGDPLLRVARPSSLELTVEPLAEDAANIRVSGRMPEAGDLVLELCYKRDRLRIRPELRKTFDESRAALVRYDETYRHSNNLICIAKSFAVQAGSFSAELPIPDGASGECHVRGYLKTDRQAWTQAVPITLK